MIEHQTFTPLLLQKSDMMDRNIIICNGTSECLLYNIEDYIKFISQVLHDETFLMELNKTMLAITLMFKGKDVIMQNHSIFVKACKTIEELQRLVAEENFKKEILSVCEEKILGKQMALAD